MKKSHASDLFDPNLKIAIIGGGISGLTAARALQERGYTHVTVFEKERDVGGKIQTITYGGHVYELGAIVANHDFKTVMQLAADNQVACTKTEDACLIDEQGAILTYRDYVRERLGLTSFLRSSAHFWETTRQHTALQRAGFAGVDRDLFLPMSQFAAKHAMAEAASVIQPFLAGCGYGYYDDVPALYLMKLAPWVLKQPFANLLTGGHSQTWSTFDQGWQHLLQKMARGVDVETRACVTAVHRNHGQRAAPIAVTSHGERLAFDRLIIASPLDEALTFLDADDLERDLFSRIRYVRYLSTLVEGENLFTVHFLRHVTAATTGHINCIVREHAGDGLFQIYQMLDGDMTADDALRLAQADVRLIDGSIKQVVAQKEWRYFPHVLTSDLEEGYYEMLEGLQGTRGTYYAGSLLNFETVEHNALYTKNLIERFF